MLIPTPELVDEYIRQIPPGRTSSLNQMRKDLAAEFGADYCCPVTAGIFTRIAAEAAVEEWEHGTSVQDIAPFWRILNTDAPATKKLTVSGLALWQKMREQEN